MNRNHVSDNGMIQFFKIEALCSFEFLDSPVRKKNEPKIELRKFQRGNIKGENWNLEIIKWKGENFLASEFLASFLTLGGIGNRKEKQIYLDRNEETALAQSLLRYSKILSLFKRASCLPSSYALLTPIGSV